MQKCWLLDSPFVQENTGDSLQSYGFELMVLMGTTGFVPLLAILN